MRFRTELGVGRIPYYDGCAFDFVDLLLQPYAGSVDLSDILDLY
jgi:hypothetical protein